MLSAATAASLAAATLVMVPASATAATTISWGATQPVGASGSVPSIAMSFDGTRATAVWYVRDSKLIVANSATISGNVATWGTPFTVASDVNMNGNGVSQVDIDVSDDGSVAAAIWRDDDNNNWRTYSATAAVNGTAATWGAPVALSAAGTGPQGIGVQTRLSADGAKAVYVWVREYDDESHTYVESAAANVSGATQTPGPVAIASVPSENDTPQYPQLVLSDDATAASVIYARSQPFSTSATISGTTISWGPRTELATASIRQDQVRLTGSSDGTTITAAWAGQTGSSFNHVAQSATATVSGTTQTWGPTTELSSDDTNVRYLSLAGSGDGASVLAAWNLVPGGNKAQTAVGTVAGTTQTWSSAADLGADGQGINKVQVAMAKEGGRGSVIFERNQPEQQVAGAAVSITGTTQDWSPISVLSDVTGVGEPELASSATGCTVTSIFAARAGSGNLAVRNTTGTIECPVAITGITPTTGPEAGGQTVTVTGQNFVSGMQIRLGSSLCQPVTVLSSTRATCSTPPGTGTVDVQVEVANAGTATLPAAYTYVASAAGPAITQVTPSAGPESGGTRITITGSGFVEGARVTIGGKACADVTFESATRLRCTTPKGRPGTVDVTVTNPDGRQATATGAFRYRKSQALTLKVIAAKRGDVMVNRRTAVVRNVTTNGRDRIRVQCFLRGNLLRGADARAVCDPVVKRSEGRVTVQPSCTQGVKIRVTVRASRPGSDPQSWRRTWTVDGNRAVACSLPGTG